MLRNSRNYLQRTLYSPKNNETKFTVLYFRRILEIDINTRAEGGHELLYINIVNSFVSCTFVCFLIICCNWLEARERQISLQHNLLFSSGAGAHFVSLGGKRRLGLLFVYSCKGGANKCNSYETTR